MNREETREAARVMLAYADGQDVQFYCDMEHEWHDTDDPTWRWDKTRYRVKPREWWIVNFEDRDSIVCVTAGAAKRMAAGCHANIIKVREVRDES